MQKLKILNSKEKKRLLTKIKEQFNSDFKLKYAVFKNNKNKIYILNKDVSKIDVEELRINSLGLYLGVEYDNSVRLSIEGSQIIGKTAKKNVLELENETAARWVSGEDIEIDTKLKGFVIIKNRDDFLGCGKIAGNKLLNYVPKTRRV